MENLELTALIPQAQAGDMAAMEELLRRAHTPVSYQCRKMLKDPRDAEDMTQEVLLTVYTRLELLKNPAAFWGWLNNITVNRCVNAIKRTHVEFQFAEDEEGHSVLDSLEELDEQQIPDKALDNAETTRMIEEIVSGLSDAQRICTLMFYYDEMSVREIASVLEIPENTVKSRLNYARKAIKERVLDYEKQGVKLYGLSPLPFLLYFLRRGADAAANPADAAAIAEKVLLSAGVKTAASAAAGSAKTAAAESAAPSAAAGSAAKAAGGISAKLIAGIAAAVIAAGAAVGGIAALQNRAPEPEIMEESPAIVLSQAYIDRLPYTGEECVLSADQARAFAEVIRRCGDESGAASAGFSRYCRAALFDAGDGIPALLISSGDDLGYGDDSGYLPSLTAVYQWDGTQAVLFQEDNASDCVVTGQGLLIDTLGRDETEYAYSVVYPLAGGIIGPQASHVYELFPLLQPGMPSEDDLRALVARNGRSAEYNYDTLSQASWATEELWAPLWTIAALDGAFRSPDDQEGQVYTYATVDWLVGHGQAGITDASHLWEGEWMDALPTAQILEEGAAAAEAEQGVDPGGANRVNRRPPRPPPPPTRTAPP